MRKPCTSSAAHDTICTWASELLRECEESTRSSQLTPPKRRKIYKDISYGHVEQAIESLTSIRLMMRITDDELSDAPGKLSSEFLEFDHSPELLEVAAVEGASHVVSVSVDSRGTSATLSSGDPIRPTL